MKLYFYILDVGKGGQPFLKIKACEAIQKNGLLYPKTEFPGNEAFITPGDIGNLTVRRWVREIPQVILTKPDLNLAKQLFFEYIDKKIAFCKEKIEMFEEKKKVVEGAKDHERD